MSDPCDAIKGPAKAYCERDPGSNVPPARTAAAGSPAAPRTPQEIS